MQGDLGCVSLIKSKIGFLNLDKSENGLGVSLQIKTNRLIQDHSDHGASKKPKNPLDMDPFSVFSIKPKSGASGPGCSKPD